MLVVVNPKCQQLLKRLSIWNIGLCQMSGEWGLFSCFHHSFSYIDWWWRRLTAETEMPLPLSDGH